MTEEKPLLESQLKVQRKRASEAVSNPEEVKRLTGVVNSARKELTKAEAASKSIEDKVKKINDDIEEISGGKVKTGQKLIAELTKKIDKTRGEICRLQVGIKTAER